MNSQSDYNQSLLQYLTHEPTHDQVKAIEAISSFLKDTTDKTAFILKGYAGTGKTTLMAALVHSLKANQKNCVLLAPTGRAAKVLSSYTRQKAFTIHKKIYHAKKNAFGGIGLALQENKFSNTLFIVDEASMIPDMNSSGNNVFNQRSLLDDLLHYVFAGKNCKLILVGDTAQLPPVGAEFSPALDIDFLNKNFSLNIHQFELTEVVRQEEKSGILFNATEIRNKIKEDKINPPFFNLKNFKDIQKVLGGDLEDLLNQHFAHRELEDSIVICRTNKRANIFNREIRNRILFREHEISAGDYLMVVKNNYFWVDETSEIGFIANGDIAEITHIQRYEELYGFRFANVTLRLIDYPDLPFVECKILLDTLSSESPALNYEQSKQLYEEVMKDFEDLSHAPQLKKVKESPYYNALQVKFSYALTCHKTQGGQWKNVFIEQGYLTTEMLNKEFLRWLYTAITRSTEKVYMLNFKDEFF